MATFNEKTGNIDLSVEDVEMFKEVNRSMSAGKTPWANSILKAILPKELHESFNLKKHD